MRCKIGRSAKICYNRCYFNSALTDKHNKNISNHHSLSAHYVPGNLQPWCHYLFSRTFMLWILLLLYYRWGKHVQKYWIGNLPKITQAVKWQNRKLEQDAEASTKEALINTKTSQSMTRPEIMGINYVFFGRWGKLFHLTLEVKNRVGSWWTRIIPRILKFLLVLSRYSKELLIT